MTTEYLYTLTVVAPVAEVPAVRALFAIFDGPAAEGDPPLGLALTSDGQNITHRAANTPITEQTRQSLLSFKESGGVPGGTEYMILPSDPSGTVVGSSLVGFNPAADALPSALFQAMGLSVYDPIPVD